jgi:hypothetical protein
MVQYDNILFLLSIFLILVILFLVLFGCRRTRIINANYERFTNINDNDEKEELTEITETKTKNDKTKKEKEVEKLSTFEKSILDGLSSGSLTTDNLSTLIKEEKFTENNLENLINYVEHFKGNVPSS